MGELRSLNAPRDVLLKSIAEAPPDAILVLIVDQPTTDNTRVAWHAPSQPGARAWSYIASIFHAFANGAIKRAP